MSTAVLLGRDSWSHFPVRKYRDVSKTETIATFLENENAPPVDQHFNQWVNGAVGVIEGKRKNRVVVRAAGHNQSLPNSIPGYRFISQILMELTQPKVCIIYVMDRIGSRKKP